MYNIIFAITSFAEYLIIYNFYNQISTRKLSQLKCFFIGLALFESCAIINIIFSNTTWLNAIYNIGVYILFGLLCFNIKPNKAVFYSVGLNILCGALEFIAAFLISAVTKTQTNTNLEEFNTLIIGAAISKSLYLITCLLLIKIIIKDKSEAKIPIALFIYPTIVICTLLLFWKFSVEFNVSKELQILLSAVSMLLFISVVILFLIYQHGIERENQLYSLHNEMEKIKIDRSYYDILQKQNENLLMYAHDAKKHLAAIESLNSNEQIAKYISTMTNELKSYSNICHSTNNALNVIIGRYITECEIKEINFSFDVHISSLNYIDDYDLVTVLGNLLDNALEAAEKSKEKIITLSTDHRNTYDVLILTNSCDEPPLANNKHLLTTKKNKNSHGIGIKSAKKALKKYNGDIEWDYDDKNNIFTLTVAILTELPKQM